MASTRDELFSAIETGDADKVRALVAADPSLASERDEEGVSALMRARYRSDGSVVEALLVTGSELDVFEASALGDIGRLSALLADDPYLADARSSDGFTVLHLAAFFGESEAARLLIARGAEVDPRGSGWMTGTPLHSAASSRHTDIAVLLLEAGADPDARQSGGWTPIHSAALNRDAPLVEELLQRGADPSATNDDGRSVLDLAEDGGDPDVIARIEEALATT
jgi:ankyrin repeat protein